MSFILQILYAPEAKTPQEAWAAVADLAVSSEQVDDNVRRMTRFAQSVLRYYPNIENDKDGKRAFFPEGINVESVASEARERFYWNLLVGAKGQSVKVFSNLSNLAAQEGLHILDDQNGMLWRADGCGITISKQIWSIKEFNPPKNVTPASDDQIGLNEAKYLLAQAIETYLGEFQLKLCTDFRYRIYWSKSKEVAWGLQVGAFYSKDGELQVHPKLVFAHFSLSKRVERKLSIELAETGESIREQSARRRRRLKKNHFDFSLILWRLSPLPYATSTALEPIKNPTYDRVKAFLQMNVNGWLGPTVLPRLQEVTDGPSLCRFFDNPEYRSLFSGNTYDAREQRFILALMTEYKSPNLAEWRKALPYEWSDADAKV
jgi:hypothetical protein